MDIRVQANVLYSKSRGEARCDICHSLFTAVTALLGSQLFVLREVKEKKDFTDDFWTMMDESTELEMYK